MVLGSMRVVPLALSCVAMMPCRSMMTSLCVGTRSPPASDSAASAGCGGAAAVSPPPPPPECDADDDLSAAASASPPPAPPPARPRPSRAARYIIHIIYI